jgi:hypothetical protein
MDVLREMIESKKISVELPSDLWVVLSPFVSSTRKVNAYLLLHNNVFQYSHFDGLLTHIQSIQEGYSVKNEGERQRFTAEETREQGIATLSEMCDVLAYNHFHSAGLFAAERLKPLKKSTKE